MSKTPRDPGRPVFSRRAFLQGASAAAVVSSAAARTAGAADGPERFPPGEHEIELRVNGRKVAVKVEPRTTLLEALRDRLHLSGAKKICDRGACGGCTVLLDGEPVDSCMMLAFDARGREITTIEGLAEREDPLIESFARADAMQCGFCTPGMVMSAHACRKKRGAPTREQIRHDLAGNLCRCGTYGRVFEAVENAARGGGR
ncbi:MAG: hypothetical protein Fur0037_07450 [Planctomycetota bacterium]